MMVAANADPADIPAHLQTRPGKRRWLESQQEASVTAETSASSDPAPTRDRSGAGRWREQESGPEVRTNITTPPERSLL